LKQITNWRNATVSDIETDALFAYTKVHVLSYKLVGEPIASLKGSVKKNLRAFLNHHLNKGIPIIFHNGICFDIPALEYLLDMDLSKLMVIDTLDLSWYLNHKRDIHGLDSFFEDYGVEKLKVDESEWAFVSNDPVETKAHYERMKLRCTSDVEINSHLWVDLMERLEIMYGYTKKCIDDGEVDGTRVSDDEVCYIDMYKNSSTVDDYIDRIISFLMMKADNRRLKEKTRWKIDVPKLEALDVLLGGHIEDAKAELGGVMPKVPKYVKRDEPANLFKKNRELSAHAIKWNAYLDTIDTLDELGNPIAYVDEDGQCWRFTNYEEPNVNSPQQIKQWLFANGWKPRTFKWVKDKKEQQAWVDSGFKRELKPKPRGIPQINMESEDGKELCHSVTKLAETIPEIMAYSKYSMIKHRFDMIQGFKSNMSEDGYLKAEVGGTTNTLRVKHRKVANLPAIDKPYGLDIRGVFICVDGNIQLGSDLSGLEDRTKHHFMIPHDPEYVKTMMSEDYDAHITMALTAFLVTESEFTDFMHDKVNKKKPDFKPKLCKEDKVRIGVLRAMGKTVNYASVYNAGAETIARDSGMSKKQATELLTAYWELNWSVKVIAAEQVVFETDWGNWLINPINGFCYSLRKDSDRFSTLCQGTGSFFFDMWVDNILEEMYSRWGVKRLSADFHDEFIMNFKDTPKFRKIMSDITLEAIDKVNETYILRRKLGADIQFGLTYADIH